jgi:hypothetical protein
MMTKKFSLTFCAAALFAAAAVAASVHAQKRAEAPADARQTRHDAKGHDAAAHADCPLMSDGKAGAKAEGGGHGSHLAEVNARGERAMGFSQTETAHHFRLTPDGGLIEVETKDPADAANRARVRQHLARVSEMFAAGDFDTPLLVHARTPPGVERMSRLRAEILYTFEETERGGRVRISTRNPDALAAVHEFLRFQIEDHQTGDKQEAGRSRQ